MSEITDTSTIRDTRETVVEDAQQPAKRRRRTGWDITEPPASSLSPAASTPGPTISAPAVVASSSSSLSPNLVGTTTASPAPNPQLLIQQLLAKPSIASIIGTSKPGCRLYVGSLHYDLKEPDVMKLFSAFGPVVKCDMSFEPATGKSKGFCFIEFGEPQHAEAAMIMNGLDIAGRKIRVGKPTQGASTVFSHTVGAPALNLAQMTPPPPPMTFMQPPLPSGPPPVPPPPSTAPPPALSVPSTNFVTVSNIKMPIPVEEVQNIFSLHGSIKNVKKLAAMQKDSKEYYDLLIEYHDAKDATSAANLTNGHVLSGTAIEVKTMSLQNAIELMMKSVEQTTCTSVLLEHMVTVEDTADPNLNDEIALEARNYGTLVNIDINVIDREKDVVHVTLKYADPAAATKASKALGNRLFAGRRIRATLIA